MVTFVERGGPVSLLLVGHEVMITWHDEDAYASEPDRDLAF
jgi:hypothetical protein